MTNEFIYNYRAVAFLDVLGFKEKLKGFQLEAVDHYTSVGDEDYGEGEDVPIPVYYSKKAAEFIETFKKATSKLDPEVFNYFLFSDNICITGKDNQNENSLTDLLFVICELYYEFAKQGYFLRGGIDFGLFVDDETLAVGLPLAIAYELETKIALFPRIVLSDNFVKQFETYDLSSSSEFSTLISKSCQINYLNVFNQVFKTDQKKEFFANFNEKIRSNLIDNERNEHIYMKFTWLADDLNRFIDLYTGSIAYYDADDEPTEDYINYIKTLKIDYAY